VLRHIDNTPPQCTFCRISAIKELRQRGINDLDPEYNYYIELLPSESVSHLFWECEHVQNVIHTCYRWLRGLDWYRGAERVDKQSFFCGIDHEFKGISHADLIWKHYVKYFIFTCKNRKALPKFPSLRYELEGVFNSPSMTRYRDKIRRINILYQE
jgi:hypothetical protein